MNSQKMSPRQQSASQNPIRTGSPPDDDDPAALVNCGGGDNRFATDGEVGRSDRLPERRSSPADVPPTTRVEQPGDMLLRSLRILLQQILCRQRNYEPHLSLAQRALAALPLTTSEYIQAVSNVQNVKNYLNRNERGAAKFELVSLLRRLPRILEAI